MGHLGVIFSDARSLLELRSGQAGGKAVTLGRLKVYLHGSDLRQLRGLAPKDASAETWFATYSWGDYAETFFRDVLKFESTESIDFSNYEGASIIHDIGEPLPEAYRNNFDLAMDGGTLEHVFNFPQAIGNLMRLVRMGGIVYSCGPCNNLCGHGFYQFSPELMHRIFSADNGFETIFVRVAKARYVSVELSSGHAVYDVTDPNSSHQRVNLITSAPVLIMTMARRIAQIEPFQNKVLQSDYVKKWEGYGVQPGTLKRLQRAIRRKIPVSLMNHILGFHDRRKASLRYKKHYRSVW